MPKLTEHFEAWEFECHCGCGLNIVSFVLVSRLETIRQLSNCTMRVLSGCRCPKYNAEVGGVRNSAHLTGEAADIYCVDSTKRWKLLEAAYTIPIKRIGEDTQYIHFDISNTLPQPKHWRYDV